MTEFTRRSIGDFFRAFTDDWVRHDPELATATRYFTGDEQDRLEGTKLIELREQAKKVLGERFSLREYHNVVLTTGVVPLELLAREVDRYAEKTART